MTAPLGRAVRRRRRWSWTQCTGAVVAVVASLAALSLPGAARAATNTYDQMTGVGSTASAVTVDWTKGLLDNTNIPLTSGTGDGSNGDRTNKSSEWWYMYQAFQTLSVTVSQTQDIGHQGITVSWNWVPTVEAGNQVYGVFLQLMECYGDASTGPTPEQCQYGSPGLLPNGAPSGLAARTGPLCTSQTPSTSNPPGSLNGGGPGQGCDPAEPSDPTHMAPCSPSPAPFCNPDEFDIPFDPVTDTNQSALDYNEGDTTYYNRFNTNEVQEAVSNSSGTGQLQFETLTGTQAPGLGCGEAESDNSTRGCWLVIVPRGEYEPNGYDKINKTTGNDFQIVSSPLSATNWAQRIQIHLGYSPVGSFCAAGTAEIQTFGTQVITRAMQSWQIALNQTGNCKTVYAYSAVTEQQSTLNETAGGDVGLAFTTIPIGSEATRSGGSPPANLPTILYAPVAVAALDFGFNINIGIGTSTGLVTTPVKLTPLLAAKAVTQSYLQDLPDYYPAGGVTPAGALKYPGPTWAQGNPQNISGDSTFQTLNPEVPSFDGGPLAPLLTEDHSALNQQIWNWIQSSSAAATWLGGTPDASDGNMQVDPAYSALNLGTTSTTDSFPRAYSACLDLGKSPGANPKEEEKCSLDLVPYTDNYDSAAAAVLAANNPDENGPWDPQAVAPDQSLGWWDKEGTEPLGQIWMWAADDTPDLAAYGLIPAQLCNDSGSACISPSTTSVAAAVSNAKADTAGLLEVNPASPGTGGYPLTQIIYAAVATNQSAAALGEYANLISYAIGTGQTTGTTPGDLPPGYLPLPSTLVTQAQSVVSQLQALASPSPSPSTSTSASTSSTTSSSQFTSSSAAAGATTGSSTIAASTSTTASTAGTTPTPAPGTTATQAPAASSSLAKVPVTSSSSYRAVALSSPTTPGPVISLPQAQVAAGTTPQQAVGAFRWALIAIAIVGGGFAGGGTVLRSGGLMLWRRRRLL